MTTTTTKQQQQRTNFDLKSSNEPLGSGELTKTPIISLNLFTSLVDLHFSPLS